MDDGTPRELDDRGMEVLTRDECIRLLQLAHVGRIGLTAGSLPIILPLNFAMDDESIVFCTEPGAKLTAARAGDVVCLEIDDADDLNHEGWSVLVTGRLQEITDSGEAAAARQLPVRPWKATASPSYVRLPLELVSGRRLSHLHHPAPRH